jgi:hypothetical protein
MGWKKIGFETVLDVGGFIVKNLTQEAKEYVNNLSPMVNFPGLNMFV